MGVVYRATHAMLRRPAAIKLLLKDRVSETDLARFEREVQLTSRLAHPNTISIFDYGRTAEGVFYYVMEYLDGLDLQRLVEQVGPVEPARAIHILAQICGALAEAHALGLIHRDIKPANIVLTERPDEPDVVKVVDFGLVKRFGGNLAESAAGDAIIGTPLYMAPEAISQPDTIDGRSDLYAVGAVAYFLLTGQHVFQAATVIEICSKHMLETPVPPSQRLGKALPADLEAHRARVSREGSATPVPRRPRFCGPPSSPARTPHASTCRPLGLGGKPAAPHRRIAPAWPTTAASGQPPWRSISATAAPKCAVGWSETEAVKVGRAVKPLASARRSSSRQRRSEPHPRARTDRTRGGPPRSRGCELARLPRPASGREDRGA